MTGDGTAGQTTQLVASTHARVFQVTTERPQRKPGHARTRFASTVCRLLCRSSFWLLSWHV